MTGARGEAIIALPDGGEIRALYTNRALADAEKAMGKDVLSVAQGFTDGHGGIGDIAAILWAGMEAARRESRTGSRQVSMRDAFKVLDQVGFTSVAREVMVAVAEVLGYGAEAESGDGDEDPNV